MTRRAAAAASYGISKAAQNALTRTLAAELAETSILINAVCPGLTATWPGAEEMGAPPSHGRRRFDHLGRHAGDDGPSGGVFRDGSPLPW